MISRYRQGLVGAASSAPFDLNDVDDGHDGSLDDSSRFVARQAVVRRPPAVVPQEERDEHEASGHAAHRSWCVHCMAARAAMPPHIRISLEADGGVARISIYYYFMGDRDSSMCLLAGKDSLSNCFVSSVVEQKGDDKFAVKLLVDFVTIIWVHEDYFQVR